MSGFRLAIRSLRRRPGFCAVVIATLALGIGATSAIFTVVNAVLLKPLPYRAPDRLVMIWSRWSNFNKTWISQDEYFGYRQETRIFTDVAAWSDNGEVTITGPDAPPISSAAMAATANLLSVVGMPPLLGRTFSPTEDAPNGPPVVMIGYQLWQRRWGGDRLLVGRTIVIDGAAARVVGILRPAFRYPLEFQQLAGAQVVQPIQFDPGTPNRGGHCCYGIARLRPGITAAMASQDVASLAARWTAEGLYAKQMHFTALAVPLLDEVSGGARLALIVLAAAVSLLLALTCANVANLVLARADARNREVAVRAALGAGTWDILRLALTESVLLGITGGLLGLGLAWSGVRILVARAPTTIPRVAELSVDWRVVVFTLALSVGTGIAFGLAPLARSGRLELANDLREGRGQSGGRERQRGRAALVVAEMALAVVLLIGAGLTVRSFAGLTRINAGFDAHNVMTMRISLPAQQYATTESADNFFRQLGAAVAELPGVRAAGFARLLPLASTMGDAGLRIRGKPLPTGQPGRQADWQAVSPGYFGAMRIPLISGRYFDQRDDAAGAPVIIVNRELVREYFPGEDPIGQGIQVGRDSTWRTVVGVVGDVHHNGLLGQLKRGWYLPEDQWASAWGNPRRSMTLVVRTVGDPHQIVSPVQQIARGMDSNLPLTDVTSMADVLAAATQEQRFTMAVMSAFAALALVLAGVGIYGVISYSVNQRTREIGIRLALGARTDSVRNLVIRQGLVPALAGIGVGLGAAAMLTRFLATMLYGVAPIDALTFTAIPIALLLVAAGSVFLPALRASRIEPLEALRAE